MALSENIEEVLAQFPFDFTKGKGGTYWAARRFDGEPHPRKDKLKVFKNKHSIWMIMEEGGLSTSVNKYVSNFIDKHGKFINNKFNNIEPVEVKPHKVIDYEKHVKPTIGKQCHLRLYFYGLFARRRVDNTFNKYNVGTEDGATIFWYCNKKKEIVHDNRIYYDLNGHRNKKYNPFRKFKVVSDYTYQTIFGIHLYNPKVHKNVFVVESEKTALYMMLYENDKENLWVATSGMSKMYKKELDKIKCPIYLVPDYSDKAVDSWRYKAKGLKNCILSEWWKLYQEVNYNEDIMDVLLREKPFKIR